MSWQRAIETAIQGGAGVVGWRESEERGKESAHYNQKSGLSAMVGTHAAGGTDGWLS